MAKNITSQVQAPITFAVPKVLAEVFKLQTDTSALRKKHRIRIARSKHKVQFGQPDPDKTDDWYLAQERPIAEETQQCYLRRGGTLFRDATGLTADISSPGQAKSPAGDPWALLDARSGSLGTSRTNKAALQYFLVEKIGCWKAEVDRLLRRLHPGMSRDAQRDWRAQTKIALTTLVSLANALGAMPQGRSAKFSPGSSFKPVKKSKSTSVRYAEEGWEWADSDEGKLWCMRKNVVVRPSQYRDWPKFLEELRADTTRELALPEIVLSWEVKLSADWSHPTRTNLHISLENVSKEPPRGGDLTDQSIFQVHLEVSMMQALHAPLRLGRVEASYRYNSFLDYPAMGFNGGVQLQHSPDPTSVRLRTTWAPRYTQPRITPKSYEGITPTMRLLATPEGLGAVLPLGDALDAWFGGLDGAVDLAAGLEASDKAGLEREQGGFAKDKQGWEKEIAAVKAGLNILQESKAAWDKTAKRGPQADDKAMVHEAWLCMNEAMADLMRDKLKSDDGTWRLFQIAFVIAHVPAIASRMKCFRDKFDRERDDTVSLLYFATGGGKSEAFFGLLVLSLFLDRLRGKLVGVTAMIRYPLRLLTIQQAQRCALALAKAEQVRKRLAIDGDPFAIGFWVGSGGSPNNHYAAGVSDIPDIQDVAADIKSERELEGDEVNYELQKAAWNKIPSCPFCRSETVLRRFSDKGGTLAHVCSNAKCESNTGGYQPLPFYICDVDIYDLAPSVLLGTVDKLALIGQSSGTLRRIYAMLGAAPMRDRATKRLVMPSKASEFEGDVEAKGYEKLYPAYLDGTPLFHDPFPSLLVQDEAHLLDESLGTFAGLFESALDAVLTSIAKPLYELVSYEPDGSTRRRAKVVAASATVSDPDRQLEHLYQRPVPAMQFPYPGQSLYESFYAGPTAPPADETQRAALKNVEEWSCWSRVYVGFMTNGRAHTATTVAVLSNFHTIITELLLALTSGDEARVAGARAKLVDSVSPGTLEQLYRDKLLSATPSDLSTIVDLHRIALTYVTNKKGGDQIMAAEFEETRKRHAERRLPISDLRTELITGSVSQGEIQATVQEAQTRPKPGEPLPELTDALRSVIATSAVSHGVDVEEFLAPVQQPSSRCRGESSRSTFRSSDHDGRRDLPSLCLGRCSPLTGFVSGNCHSEAA